MSLDVYLIGDITRPAGTGIFIREDGSTREISREEWDSRFPNTEPVTVHDDERDECYSSNITHNLGAMAAAAGIYKHLWEPEEVGITHAAELIEPLTSGLQALHADPDKFKALNPANGWGNYAGLVAFVTDYLAACREYPNATVKVWR